MRILFIHSELGVLAGGGENFSRHLMTALRQRGHRISVVFTAHRDGTYPIPMPPGVAEEPLCGYWSRQLGQTALSRLSRYVEGVPALQEFWKRVQLGAAWRASGWHNHRFRRRVMQRLSGRWSSFDLAYIHGEPRLAAEVARELPTCIRLPGPVGEDQITNLEKVQLILANGDALNSLRSLLGGKKAVQELSIGLDAAHFSPTGGNFREKLGWGGEEVVLGYAGRLTVLKGVKILAEAFCRLAQEYPDLRLLLVGDGEEGRTIAAMLGQAGLQNRSHLAGVQPYELMPAWYRSMDLFVMPSRYENFSNALLEAMGCGLPAVASRVGGNLMAIEEPANGWFFEAGAPGSLADTLVTAIVHRPEWPAMGRFSRALVEHKYSWDYTASTFEEITRPLINSQ
jgi:glycosyltransferase involved in cell wall biosynthesis